MLIEPAGIEPAGIEPAGIEPAGIEPAGVDPSWPEIETPRAVFVERSTPVSRPPLSVIASFQVTYGCPSAFRGVGSEPRGAFPSISTENGMLRQSVVKSGTFFNG